MKTAYKFDSKHLGQAFLEELKSLGYETESTIRGDHSCISKELRENIVVAWYMDRSRICDYVFQLETQWVEAYDFAKKQINTKNKFFDWDVEDKETHYQIGCKSFDKKFLSAMAQALSHVPLHTAEEIRIELKKLDL